LTKFFFFCTIFYYRRYLLNIHFRDHKSFFDKLYNNGVDPIYILITYAISTPFAYLGPSDAQPTTGGYSFQTADGKWYQIDDSKEAANAQERQIQSNIVTEIAQRYGSHPAVMGFVIGNEQNNAVTRANCEFWKWIDSMATRVKQAAPTKLTATTIVDDDFLTVNSAMQCSPLTHMDVWGINAYRGTATQGFDELFNKFSTLTQQALLITEFGCPSSTRDEANNFVMMPENSKLQADYLQVHWEDIVAHNTICSGGYAFSWVDEWWKLGDTTFQNQDDARNYAFPGTYADEESYGIVAVNVDCDKINDWATRTDAVLPRAVYFVLGKLFGAWTDVPSQAYLPISYPRCNGKWVGTPGAPNAVTPVHPQGPVASIPLSGPSQTPSVIATPIDGTGNQNVNSASGIVCSFAVIAISLIALAF